MNESDRQRAIDVRLREYEALRQEVLMRARTRYELVATLVAIAALVGVIGDIEERSSAPLLVMVGIVLVIISIVWLWLGVAISRCSGVIAEIEGAVETLANIGPLLTWETRQTRWREEVPWRKRVWSARLPYAPEPESD